VALKNSGNVADLTGGLLAAAGRSQVQDRSMGRGAMTIRSLGIKIKPGDSAASVANHMHFDDVHMHGRIPASLGDADPPSPLTEAIGGCHVL
jgi:hypothetical protein